MKNFNVHVKHGISLSRIREKTQVGLEPKYQRNFRGVDLMMDAKGIYSNSSRYRKNVARMKGLCRGCENFVPSKAKTTTGEHCSKEFCIK